jgi:bleomycin hydrolase
MGTHQSVELSPRERRRAAQPTTPPSNEKDAHRAAAPTKLVREPAGLAISTLSGWQSSLLKSPKNRLALTALSSADPRKVLTSQSAEVADQQVFNVRIPFEGAPITNQRSSGRCWLFASTNVFRVALMKKYHLEEF